MEGEVVRADSDQHTHPTNVDQLVAEDIERSVINNNCENSTNRAIIAKIKERCNDESVSDKMSNIRNLTQRAQRKRTEVKSEGPRIRTFADLDLLPTEYTEFLVHCEENVFIFMEKNGFEILNKCQTWCMDGTHSKCPTPFVQIYVIGGIFNRKMYPSVYCLLPNHESSSYDVILKYLKSCIENSPSRFILDFEIAMFKSIAKSFPTVKITGCVFHFFQNLEKNLKKKGLVTLRNNNEHVKKAILMIKSLVYAPPGFVLDVFDKYICNYIKVNGLNDIPEFQSFVCYFETSYLGKKQKRSRKKPTFSLDSWNMFHELCDNLPTTNNSMEQWNREFNQNNVGKQNIYTCIKGFKREILFCEAKWSELCQGSLIETETSRRRKLAEEREKKLVVMRSFSLENVSDFVDNMILLL